MPLSLCIIYVPERQIFGKAQSTMIRCGRLPSQQQQARVTRFGTSIRVCVSVTFLSPSAHAYLMAIRSPSRSGLVTRFIGLFCIQRMTILNNSPLHTYTIVHSHIFTAVARLLLPGFQRQTFPILWVPELSPCLSYSNP
jgi:hypothetical protein